MTQMIIHILAGIGAVAVVVVFGGLLLTFWGLVRMTGPTPYDLPRVDYEEWMEAERSGERK